MNSDLMIYVCDFGWMGSIVVIAKSKEDARKLMESCENYRSKVRNGELPEIEEFALVDGFIHCDTGDM